MIIEKDRPVTIAVHPKLEVELKMRKQELEDVTGKPIKGGLTTYSQMAAFELETIRKSGNYILKEILNIKNVKIYKLNTGSESIDVVPYDYFKKLFILSSILNKRKDQKQIKVDLTKLKGLKKNDVKIYW